MQIDKRLNLKRPESDFDRGLESELLKAWGKLAQVINKGVGIDNVAEVWEDLRIAALSTRTNASAPDLITIGPSGGLLTLGFNGDATAEQCYFAIQLPHSYKQGSDIYPHVHWCPVNTNAGNVLWQLEYSWANINGTFEAPTTIESLDAADGTAWKHQLASFPAITGTGKTISSMIVCRLFRNPADGDDTYGSDAALLEFDIHYQIDSLGSQEETTKLYT